MEILTSSSVPLERAASSKAFHRRHLLSPSFRPAPAAFARQDLSCKRRSHRLTCRAASSTEPGSLKFVTQGRNLKLTDALRDFAVSDDIVAL